MGKTQKTRPRRLPKLCRNKLKDFAYVTDPRTGNQIYMGPWGGVETQTKYAAWLADFVKDMQIIPAIAAAPPTIGHLATRWLEYCRQTYRRADGKATGEVGICQQAASLLMPFADQPIDEFSRAHLISIRDQLVATGLSRSTIKHYISRIVRMFKFGSDREWINSEHILRLEKIPNMRGDQGRAKKVVRGIPRSHLFKLFRELPTGWKKVFLFHILTAQRVETALSVTADQIDQKRCPWQYVPRQHKGLAKGLDLTILVGPRARAVIKPLMLAKSFLFPGRSAVPGTIYRGPRQYSGYAAAMERACVRAGIPHYTPRQVRHTAATYLIDRMVPEPIIGAIMGHHGKGDDDSMSTGSGTITGRYAAVPRRRVEAVVEKWG
jgi:integrase